MLSVPELGTKQDFLAEVEFSTIFPFDDFKEIQVLSWNFTSFLVNPPLSRIHKGYGVPGSRKASWHQVWKRTVGWQVFRSSRSRTRILGIRDRFIRPLDPCLGEFYFNGTSNHRINQISTLRQNVSVSFWPKSQILLNDLASKVEPESPKKRYRFQLCKLKEFYLTWK